MQKIIKPLWGTEFTEINDVEIFHSSKKMFAYDGNVGEFLVRDENALTSEHDWEIVTQEVFIELGTTEYGDRFKKWVEEKFSE